MSVTFFVFIVTIGALIALCRRVEPVVEAAAPALPAFECPVCEAPARELGARCLGCGADDDEEPLYRDGELVITPRRLIVGGRVIALEPLPATGPAVVPRGVPSGASDGAGCSLLVAGTSALLAVLFPDGAYVESLLALTVATVLASPLLLLFSYTERPELEYVVRLAAGGGEREVYASRDRARAGAVAAQLRWAIGRRPTS